MHTPPLSALIYDWNDPLSLSIPQKQVTFLDETLRDGIQSTRIHTPTVEDRLQMLRWMDQLKIEYADIGLPGAGEQTQEDVTRLVQGIQAEKLSVKPVCASRTHPDDLRAVADIVQKTGVSIEVTAFIGSSPIRHFAENWSFQDTLRRTRESIDFCRQEGLQVTFVTEDTTRSRPETLQRLFEAALEHGATRLCLCDTVGHATPHGTRNLIHFTQDLLVEWGMQHIGIDWHGHNDRGLGVANNLAAREAGADRIHGTILGVGERVGNASLDLTLLNLKLSGHLQRDLSALREYAELVSRTYRIPIPDSYPALGADAFSTATGVHASALVKAYQRGDTELADLVYSGVPASLLGKCQDIRVGPMSGMSNVLHWLQRHRYPRCESLAKTLLRYAKNHNRVLLDEEIHRLVRASFGHKKTAPKSGSQFSQPVLDQGLGGSQSSSGSEVSVRQSRQSTPSS